MTIAEDMLKALNAERESSKLPGPFETCLIFEMSRAARDALAASRSGATGAPNEDGYATSFKGVTICQIDGDSGWELVSRARSTPTHIADALPYIMREEPPLVTLRKPDPDPPSVA